LGGQRTNTIGNLPSDFWMSSEIHKAIWYDASNENTGCKMNLILFNINISIVVYFVDWFVMIAVTLVYDYLYLWSWHDYSALICLSFV